MGREPIRHVQTAERAWRLDADYGGGADGTFWKEATLLGGEIPDRRHVRHHCDGCPSPDEKAPVSQGSAGSGGEAGEAWARENDISDEYDCRGNSQSFIEGCEAFVAARMGIAEEQAREAALEEVEDLDLYERDYEDEINARRGY